jgi:uracil-DNA glycosylase family 4
MEQSLRGQYLEAMGIEQWVRRDRACAAVETQDAACAQQQQGAAATGAGGALDSQAGVFPPDWAELESQVAGCRRCVLHETRTRTVFGTGNRAADWMIIGEAPGADEDRQGEPFVGRAGQLLTAMLAAIGLRREEVFITNILKCRPPGNRDPLPAEVSCCHEYLERQIELVDPALLLVVGRIAAHNLLQTDLPIGRLRGRVHRYGTAGIPLVVTYHPAYLLRSPLEKRRAWEDLQLARQLYHGL